MRPPYGSKSLRSILKCAEAQRPRRPRFRAEVQPVLSHFTISTDSALVRWKWILYCRHKRMNKTMIAKPATVMPINLASVSKPRGCRINRSIEWLYLAARNPIAKYRRARPASTAETNLPCGYRSAPAPMKNGEVGNGGGATQETNTAANPQR